MGLHDEAKLDAKFLEFAKQMNLYLNHFPKHEKYGLSQEIRQRAYACYGFIVEAQKRYHKKTSLSNLDIAHEQLRMFVRLAFHLGYFAFKDGSDQGTSGIQPAERRYLALNRMIDDMGRQIGAWMSLERTKTTTQKENGEAP